ncbi:MAG: molecular chaperone Tir [Deltaproteobacteria bacterium]|jgi:hypothetical protein|nr:molecular chaperone Tir [Deltaproteobacteria bacterium]MBT4525624.1 molecular chaperone Tir [Deltaproteobacteria bacterium]
MSEYFDKILDFANQLSLNIVHQDEAEELIVVNNEQKGIFRMVIDCEFPILIFEQLIYEIKVDSKKHFMELLKMNRNLIHGAFVVDDSEKQLIYRDTLQLENLDFNEFEGTINALSLGLAEYSRKLMELNQLS